MVVGHLKDPGNFPKDFHYVSRKDDLQLSQQVDSKYIFNSTGLAWSEYAAWFENPELTQNSENCVGLLTYRCTLSPFIFFPRVLPFKLRHFVLQIVHKVLVNEKQVFYVGKPLKLTPNVWEHFVTPYQQFEEIMLAAAEVYDQIMGNSKDFSRETLNSTTLMYPRNIFIGPKDVADEWLQTSFAIAKKLDQLFPEPKDDRWGGYVLERLFSLFVLQLKQNNRIRVVQKPLLYFSNEKSSYKIDLSYLRIKHQIKMILVFVGLYKT